MDKANKNGITSAFKQNMSKCAVPIQWLNLLFNKLEDKC